jgi:uncharacterized protein (TIGR02266 family)
MGYYIVHNPILVWEFIMVAAENISSSQRISLISTVQCFDNTTNHAKILSMFDLSEGGIFVQTAYPLPVGVETHCTFHLGDTQKPITVNTRVAWSRPGPEEMIPPPGMGLRFKDLDENSLDRIRNIIQLHTNNVSYFREHNRLPEDAMALTPPKLSFDFNDGNSFSGNLETISETHLVATIALPFLQKGKKLKTTIDGKETLEEGKISWLSFEMDKQSGVPQLKMGIELSLNSWGEEKAKRITQPLAIRKQAPNILREQLESQIEVIQSIPASFMAAPTLPLKKNKYLPPPPEELEYQIEINNKSKPIQPVDKIEPVLSEQIIESFQSAEIVEPIPPIPEKLKYPGPLLKTDTYKIAPSSESFWPFSMKATIIVAASIVAVMVIYSLNVNHPHKKINTKKQSLNSIFNPQMKTKLPFTKGRSIFLKVQPIDITTTTKTHVDNLNKTESEVEKQPNKTDPENIEDSSIGKLIVKNSGRKLIVNVDLENSKTKISHYLLASPPGIVVNIKNSFYNVKPGIHKSKARGIRKIKIIKRKSGGRMIIYTKKSPKLVKTSTKNKNLKIAINF